MTEKHAAEADEGKGRLGEAVSFPEIRLEYPGWVRRHVDWTRLYPGQRDRMRVALMVARENIERKTGGPFGAAVFESDTGRLISVGMNQVVALSSILFHAEIIAIAMAERRLGGPGLGRRGVPLLELHMTCDPCAMCASALLLSGIPKLVCAGTCADAEASGFDSLPRAQESLQFLESQGVQVEHEVLRDEARDILQLHRAMRRSSGLPAPREDLP